MQQNRYHYIPGSIGLSIPCYVSTGSIGVVSIAVSHYPVTIFIIFLRACGSHQQAYIKLTHVSMTVRHLCMRIIIFISCCTLHVLMIHLTFLSF